MENRLQHAHHEAQLDNTLAENPSVRRDDVSHQAHTNHQGHTHHHSLAGKLLIGSSLVLAAIVAGPVLLYGADALGIIDATGPPGLNNFTMANSAITSSCSGVPSGLAQMSGNLLSHVPLIGFELSQGGWVNAVVSGAIGIGGRIAGNYINKEQGPEKGQIKWGSVIKTACLVTSLLVASPAIFTAISMGVTAWGYGSGLVNYFDTSNIVRQVVDVTGSTGNLNTSGMLGALGAIGPHVVSCLLPVIASVSALMGNKQQSDALANHLPSEPKAEVGHFTQRLNQKRQQSAHSEMSHAY